MDSGVFTFFLPAYMHDVKLIPPHGRQSKMNEGRVDGWTDGTREQRKNEGRVMMMMMTIERKSPFFLSVIFITIWC